MGEYFQRELEGLGFRADWVSLPEPVQRAGHLVAQHVAEKPEGKRVLLMGHLDTIFEGPGHRFERTGNIIRGAGAADMKGGDVVILYALKALRDAGILEHATIRVVLTGDEESPGLPGDVSRRDLREAARQSEIALSFEPDSGKIAVGRRGLTTWQLQVTGAQGHSAYVLHKGGAGAIYEAARIVDGFRSALADSPTTTLNPGLFLGGSDVLCDADHSSGTSVGKFNVVARQATVRGDLRCVSDAERDQAVEKMRAIAAANLPKTRAELVFEEVFPGWQTTDGSRAALRLIGDVSRDLGLGPLEADDPASRGAGDFGFIGSIVDGVDGLGVRGQGIHAPDEGMDLASLVPATTRAAVLIARLVQPTR